MSTAPREINRLASSSRSSGSGPFNLRAAADRGDPTVASAQKRKEFGESRMSEGFFFEEDEKHPGRNNLAGNLPGDIRGNRIVTAVQILGQSQRGIKQVE